MRPLQVWFPTFTSSLSRPAADRDMQRAFQAWRGEQVVWLLPDLSKIIRWQERPEQPGPHVVALPAERLERIEVYHVGANGQGVGPGFKSHFPTRTARGFPAPSLNPQHLRPLQR